MLADFLVAKGHEVILLRGHYSTYKGDDTAQQVQTFTTTADLRDRLRSFSQNRIEAVFHAAAVSDFGFGKIFERTEDGLTAVTGGKVSTRRGTLLAELIPTPKIISELRHTFGAARIIGWKYEVDGKREDVLVKARQQVVENKTDACVANGPAYGFGFGIVSAQTVEHLSDTNVLFAALEQIAQQR